MNDKKYYVRLRPMDTYLIRNSPSKIGVLWIDESKQPFTKSELSKIMGGAFYITLHQKSFTAPLVIGRNWIWSDELQVYEWINPLIELVPVEDGE
ncbi:MULTISPECIES: hypothetical protein [Lactococcus]|uniref:hypothetical protein n=1 Tax=Lactococcus TaxID=1357 RepID=UPI000BF73D10|nr:MULTISPECIES: hypothetical protein [Lactococcus]KAF6604967.1 hypothetical protein HFD74_14035 [Lactococcus sp. EKM201L]KAF6610235.1 hypothetical protein HFD15_13950 [Lactococcus sp. EKM203L]KAF6639738.1 hypothetical protein HFC73_14025 [Lactococcus sp. EKM501L]KAF6640362.1 hypothetical protein HFC72_14015 [Lactococcus sp. EKM502L]KAF6649118.1 hypothetical protein HFC74_14035 [Lactococcus sp. EKM101L]